MKTGLNRLLIAMTCMVMAAASLPSPGASKGFSGKWKGEIQLPAPAGRGGAAPQAPGGRQFVQRGGGGGRGGFGGDAAPGGFNRANFGGPQKVTVNIKTKDNDTKAVGNISVGEVIVDIKDGKIDGNKITFKAGDAPLIYEYSGTLEGDEIMMTRVSAGEARGRQAIQFVLKRS
jgi:hypothetical protein